MKIISLPANRMQTHYQQICTANIYYANTVKYTIFLHKMIPKYFLFVHSQYKNVMRYKCLCNVLLYAMHKLTCLPEEI
jgi:hypothetical protein